MFCYRKADFWLVQIQDDEEGDELTTAIIPVAWLLSDDKCLYLEKNKRPPPSKMEALVKSGFLPLKKSKFREHKMKLVYGDSK